MTRFLLCIIATLLALNTQATNIDLNKEYARLDEAIAQSSRYIAQRQKKIRALERQLGAAEDTRQQYQLCYQLYLLYRPYIHSQACVYLNRCITIAQKEGKHQQANHCRAILAKYFVSSGFYDEARICLQDIDTTMLDRQGQTLYDMARYALYGELAYYTTLPEMKRHYETLRNDYEKAMMPLLSKDNDVYCETRQNQLTTQGKAREALHFNDQWLKRTPSGSHDYALVTLYRYLAYKALGDTTRMLYWVTQSVINDIRLGVTDQGSIWELANQLMLSGDLQRAYRYISYASQCANTFGARQRKWQVAPLMASLAGQYKSASESSHQRLTVSLCALSVLFVIALVLLLLTIKQRNHIRRTRNLLYQSNANLQESNTRLADSNIRLADSNRVKEEYIGQFLELCSLYVNRIDKIKKRTARYLKNKQYVELERILHSKESNDEDASELYKSFDSAFIHLFPHFVEDINALLRPEAQLSVEKDGQLSTSIRIFALIRLGINDSSKIAEFLHYSVNTIYNYRARVKKGAIGDKEDFEEKVKMIGINVKNTTN
jgi:hypothetical protein